MTRSKSTFNDDSKTVGKMSRTNNGPGLVFPFEVDATDVQRDYVGGRVSRV